MTEDAASIRIATWLLNNGGIRKDLTYIDSTLAFYKIGIIKLETAGMSLKESQNIVKNLDKSIQHIRRI